MHPTMRGMMQRLLHRVLNRSFPSEQLVAIRELRDELTRHEAAVVLAMREAGYAWEDIARPMGISRQALQRKAGGWPDQETTE